MSRFKSANLRGQVLHQMLGVDTSQSIPDKTIRKVADAHIGDSIDNPSEVGHSVIKVTAAMKQQAMHTLNVGNA